MKCLQLLPLEPTDLAAVLGEQVEAVEAELLQLDAHALLGPADFEHALNMLRASVRAFAHAAADFDLLLGVGAGGQVRTLDESQHYWMELRDFLNFSAPSPAPL